MRILNSVWPFTWKSRPVTTPIIASDIASGIASGIAEETVRLLIGLGKDEQDAMICTLQVIIGHMDKPFRDTDLHLLSHAFSEIITRSTDHEALFVRSTAKIDATSRRSIVSYMLNEHTCGVRVDVPRAWVTACGSRCYRSPRTLARNIIESDEFDLTAIFAEEAEAFTQEYVWTPEEARTFHRPVHMHMSSLTFNVAKNIGKTVALNNRTSDIEVMCAIAVARDVSVEAGVDLDARLLRVLREVLYVSKDSEDLAPWTLCSTDPTHLRTRVHMLNIIVTISNMLSGRDISEVMGPGTERRLVRASKGCVVCLDEEVHGVCYFCTKCQASATCNTCFKKATEKGDKFPCPTCRGLHVIPYIALA